MTGRPNPIAGQNLALSTARLLLVSWSLTAVACGAPRTDVLSGWNDDARTGANRRETLLTPGLLTKGRFGRAFSYDVDGFVYAQPLVASDVSTASGVRDVVVVATTKNKVYGFDATQNATLWQRDLQPPGALTDTQMPVAVLAPTVGILSTPVIDRATGSVYVVARTYEPGEGLPPRHVQRLVQIALGTGDIRKTVEIGPSVTVNSISFNPENQINRPGLALVNGLVIVMWGTFLDGLTPDERGWVTAFDADTLTLKGVFCTTCFYPAGTGGMIWQSGRPPAIEADRYVYFSPATGGSTRRTRTMRYRAFPKTTPRSLTAAIPNRWSSLTPRIQVSGKTTAAWPVGRRTTGANSTRETRILAGRVRCFSRLAQVTRPSRSEVARRVSFTASTPPRSTAPIALNGRRRTPSRRSGSAP